MLTTIRRYFRLVFESAAAAPPTEGVAVQEYATSAGATLRVDRDKCIIHGVMIIGEASRNGRRYPAAVLEAAIDKYEGAKVNVGHAATPTAPRDYRDRLGVIRNVRKGEGGLFGDLHYNAKHAVAEQLAWDAENNPAAVGLSPAHICRFRNVRGVEEAEAVARVISVDLVGDPATTRGLFEEVADAEPAPQDPPTELPTIESVQDLTAAYPVLVAAVAEEATRLVKVNVTAALKALMASQLPYNAWENGMLDAIVVSESVEAAEKVVTDRCALVKSITEQMKSAPAPTLTKPQSTPKQTPGPASGVTDAKSFAARLKQ